MANLPWWAQGVPGSHGSLIGPQPAPKPFRRVKPHDPHLRYPKHFGPGVHGDLTITHQPSGAVTITHQPHGEDEFGAAPPAPVPWWRRGILARRGSTSAQAAPAAPWPASWVSTPSPIQHLIPPLDQLRRMTPVQLAALYHRLPPGAQIAGFPRPNAFYHPNDPIVAGDSGQPHGEDAGDAASPGATGSNDPNYGSGTDPLVSDVDLAAGMVRGIGTPGSFEATLAGGGLGPYAMSTLPGENGLPYNGYLNPQSALDEYADDPYSAYKPFADDPYMPPLRVPNKRNYKADFGCDDEIGLESEWYGGFGPSAVIGCEDLIVAGDIGCANDTELKG